MTPFQALQDDLRAAGCKLSRIEALETTHGSLLTVWLCSKKGSFVRLVVIDERECGYSLFIERQNSSVTVDVSHVLAALSGYPSLRKQP